MLAAIENPTEDKSLMIRLAMLAGIMVVGGFILIALGVTLFHTELRPAVIAFITCLVSALVAHVAGEYPKGDVYIMARMAVQMVVRTSLPLVVAIWGLYFAEPPLEKSLVFYMILFYFIGLITDVQLSLARLKDRIRETSKPPVNQTSNQDGL